MGHPPKRAKRFFTAVAAELLVDDIFCIVIGPPLPIRIHTSEPTNSRKQRNLRGLSCERQKYTTIDTISVRNTPPSLAKQSDSVQSDSVHVSPHSAVPRWLIR